MANYAIGSTADWDEIDQTPYAGHFLSYEDCLSDVTSNQIGNDSYQISNNVTIVANASSSNMTHYGHPFGGKQTGNYKCIDLVATGDTFTGGTFQNFILYRQTDNTGVAFNGSTLNNSTVLLQIAGSITGCTGNKNSIVTATGAITGITGADNIFTATANITDAYVDNVPALWFDGVNDYATMPNNISNSGFEFEFTMFFNGSPTNEEFVSCRNGSTGGFTVRSYEAGNINYDSWGASGFKRISHAETVGNKKILFAYEDNTKTLAINGNSSTQSANMGDFSTVTNITLGCGSFECAKTCIHSVVSNNEYSYIQKGDFGSTILPSHPSGNDGTINGATWVLSQEDPFRPKIGGTLLLPDGTYAGSSQPPAKKKNKYTYGITYGY